MTILEAMLKPSLPEAAKAYLECGISVLPLIGKKPGLERWHHLMENRAHSYEVNRWSNTGALQNVGVVCGAVSGGLAVIDLDGQKAADAFRDRWPSWWDTLRVKTGSGYHLYYYPVFPLTNYRLMGQEAHSAIEIRVTKCYVVAPPSIHPSGLPYTVPNLMEPARVDLIPILQWLQEVKRKKSAALEQATEGQSIRVDKGEIRNPSAYGRVALNDELDRLCGAREGGRNNHLYWSAFRMAQLAQLGCLTYQQIEDALSATYRQIDPNEDERQIIATIRSGVRLAVLRANWRDQ